MVFQPGTSGNPGGRPRGRSITARLHAWAEAKVRPDGSAVPDGRDNGDLIAAALVERAESGDLAAIALFLDRTEGRVTAKLELDGALTIRVEYADRDHPAPEAPPGAGADQAGPEAV